MRPLHLTGAVGDVVGAGVGAGVRLGLAVGAGVRLGLAVGAAEAKRESVKANKMETFIFLCVCLEAQIGQ